jgi:hypothetical protein
MFPFFRKLWFGLAQSVCEIGQCFQGLGQVGLVARNIGGRGVVISPPGAEEPEGSMSSPVHGSRARHIVSIIQIKITRHRIHHACMPFVDNK